MKWVTPIIFVCCYVAAIVGGAFGLWSEDWFQPVLWTGAACFLATFIFYGCAYWWRYYFVWTPEQRAEEDYWNERD